MSLPCFEFALLIIGERPVFFGIIEFILILEHGVHLDKPEYLLLICITQSFIFLLFDFLNHMCSFSLTFNDFYSCLIFDDLVFHQGYLNGFNLVFATNLFIMILSFTFEHSLSATLAQVILPHTSCIM